MGNDSPAVQPGAAEGRPTHGQRGSRADASIEERLAFADATLEERLAFERLLADLSARFANVPGDRLEDEIEDSLRKLVEFLGFDRSSFLGFSADGSRLDALCSAAVDGVEPLPRGPLPLQADWYVRELRADRVVAVRSLPEDLPPEAAAEAEYARRTGMRSNLTVPLRVGGRLVGAIAFGAFRSTRAWPEDLIARLKVVGEVFAQALARKRADAELAAALGQIKRLKARLEEENAYLRQAARPGAPKDLASRSPRFRHVLEEIRQVALTTSTVLLLGETGSGKEVLAQAIHDLSGRRARPMVKVNCAALPATLIEAELFGREKGAYTGALARQMGRFELGDGSTIFLDEIGELPLDLQAKLLRVLQGGELERVGGAQTIKVDARVIAASNRDLGRAVSEGAFREDLYYRLNVFPIEVPPLRERREDIPTLAWSFVREFSESMGKPIERIGEESMAAMQAYGWPGNVRELRNVIERAMILARDTTLHVSLGRTGAALPARRAATTLEEAERAHIVQALERTGWRIRGRGGAAALLDVKPTTLESRMAKLGLRRPR
jgi:transcriptional regulator with GAF, ATPase, and Fis domain